MDAPHSGGSAYSVILKKINYPFLCTENNNFNSILSEFLHHQNSPGLPYLLHVSFSSPACMLCRPLLYILLISHSVRIDAADLQVHLLLSELQNSYKMSHSLKPEPLLPDFTSFTGSVASQVQEPNFLAVGE